MGRIWLISAHKRKISESYSNQPSPNVSTTSITAMRCRQCLPLSVVQLKGKHCRKPHCRNGVVDMFGPPLVNVVVQWPPKVKKFWDILFERDFFVLFICFLDPRWCMFSTPHIDPAKLICTTWLIIFPLK
jgi:hypothetical protein